MAKVLITGTSSGIGYQTALVLARAGHSVYATMRNLERGAALRNAAEQEQLPISIVRMDVDSDDSVEAATSSIRAQAGCIDVLVNNAGIERSRFDRGIDARRLQSHDGDELLRPAPHDSSLAARYATTAERLHHQRHVCRRKDRLFTAHTVPASKFALEALSEGLAQEVKPFNIRVAVVEPGIIDTPMARSIEQVPADAAYPQVRRFGHMFEASLDTPTPPAIVAEKIREIIESGTLKLRHPVGPDAEGFLGVARVAE